jgi:hypothetical protein
VSRHEFDPSALVAGILFLGFALRYLNAGAGGHAVPYAFTTPAVLVGVVVILVLRRVFRSRRDS